MSVKVIFIIGAVIFYIIRAVVKNTNQQPNNQAPKPQNKTSNSQPKTAQEIYNEFIKEIEKSKNKQQAKPAVQNANQQAQSTKTTSTNKKLDWQKVETTHIVEKKQLIDHEDYHGISHRIDPIHKIQEITETEGEVFEFDTENIDWKQAIISKEILDRKYA